MAQIGTFGTLAARAVVRDAGRVLGYSYGQVDRIAKLVPERPTARARGLPQARARAPRRLRVRPSAAKTIIDTRPPLEGLTRNECVHAAGVVIGASR